MICPKCGSKKARRNGMGRLLCASCGKTSANMSASANDQDQTLAAVARECGQLRKENRRLLLESADLTIIKRAIGHINANLTNPPPLPIQTKKAAKIIHGMPTLMLSDLHFGAVVRKSQVNGVNQYNTDIAKTRIRTVAQRSVGFLRGALSPGDFGGCFILNLGGDMVDGIIHDELRESSDATVLQSLLTLLDELIPIIKMLADEFGHVRVNCVAGNHGRLDKKPRFANAAQLNFDWLLYRFLAKVIESDKKYANKVSMFVPDGMDCRYDVYKTRYLLNHGDKFKGGDGWSGVLLPWTRGETKKAKQYNAIDLPYDHLVIGHWHQANFMRRIFGNGSLIGFDPFAMQLGFNFEPPQQILWVTHPQFGAIHKTEIFAEEPKK